jgi:hypothetical protein
MMLMKKRAIDGDRMEEEEGRKNVVFWYECDGVQLEKAVVVVVEV